MNRKKDVGQKSLVAISQGTYRDADRIIEDIFRKVEYEPKKNGFFLKPNLVDAFPPRSAIVTHPAIIKAIVRYLKRNYPGREIIVGDSCGIHVPFDRVAQKTGYSRLAKKYGIKIISLDTAERYDQEWSHGKIRLPLLLKTHEYINVPKMKTHMQTSVSLGMKNQKGLLEGNTKKNFHRKYELHDCINELAAIVMPDLTIIDGILSMEGNGPLNSGIPKRDTKLVIASTNMIAADNVAATIMGYDVGSIAHIPEFSEYNIAGPSLDRCIKPHVRADDTCVRKRNACIYFDKTMCTQCAVPFIDAFHDPVFLMKYIGLGGLRDKKNIVFGKYDGSIDDPDKTIGIGDCTLKAAKKMGFPTVRGCPPTPDMIKENYLLFLKNLKT